MVQGDVTAKSRYPNELPGYRLNAEGNWKALEPWVSTKIDVYRILGEPDPVFVNDGQD